MQSRTLRIVTFAVALLALPALAVAQFGHPLKGQWSGEAGTAGDSTRLLLDLGWDGKNITGTINPGSATEAEIRKVTFDYSSDMAGRPVPMGEPIDLHEHDGDARVASAGR